MAETGQTVEDTLYCSVHPSVQTTLRCNRCGRPMCTRCAVRTPVGYRCRECVRGQQQAFYNAQALDPLIQAGVALVFGGIATGLIGLLDLVGLGFGFFGWLIAFWAGSAAGAGIADVAHRLVRRRRGRFSWLVVAGALALGGLLVSLLLGFSLARLIFVGMAAVAATGRLRLGK